jgi:hypothetical protein
MRFSIEIGISEKYTIAYSRNWFSGSEIVAINGVKIKQTSVLDPRTHFSMQLIRRSKLEIGTNEKYEVVIEKQRPILIAGLRPHKYRVYVNDKCVLEKKGY